MAGVPSFIETGLSAQIRVFLVIKNKALGDIPSRAHQELDPEEHLVLMCHHGMRSMNVAVWLRNQGFEQAQSLRGGIDAWSAQVDPSVPRY